MSAILQLRSYIEGINKLAEQRAAEQKRQLAATPVSETPIYIPDAPLPALPSPSGDSIYQSQPQEKTRPGRAGVRLDESLLTSKKPTPDLDREQRIAIPGETVPIVFGRRTDGIGGVWVQPSLVKSGSTLFVPSFLYVISQGRIDSEPRRARTWAGKQRLNLKSGVTVTVSDIYATPQSLAAAPEVCPIDGNELYCGIETISFYEPMAKAQEGAIFQEIYPGSGFEGISIITLGVGDTENTVFVFNNDESKVYRSDTGDEVTDDWNTFFSLGPEVVFVVNAEVVDGIIVGGRAVGTIRADFRDIPLLSAQAAGVVPDLPDDAYLIRVNVCDSVDKQRNPALPESTGTLYGTQVEIIWSPYEDPSDTPTADNSAYADITFLKVVGDITERESDENGRSLVPKQLSAFYARGVRVRLYSQGRIDGSYQNGPSNQLVDLISYLFRIYKRVERADGSDLPRIAAPIYRANMVDIAEFCDEYKLHFNGVIDESMNIIEFASAVAPFFLLSFLSVGGQYRLEPVLPLNSSNQIDVTALTPSATFTEADILPGSFSKSYKAATERRPITAILLWRESNPSEVGIQRTVQVAFSDTEIDAPVEQFDLTDFCCDPDHAAIYGKYEIARRQYSTHSISFQTTLILSDLIPTQIIKIERQRISSKGDDRTETDWYQITGIRFSPDGTSVIEAEHFPVTSGDVAVISDAIINGSFRVLS